MITSRACHGGRGQTVRCGHCPTRRRRRVRGRRGSPRMFGRYSAGCWDTCAHWEAYHTCKKSHLINHRNRGSGPWTGDVCRQAGKLRTRTLGIIATRPMPFNASSSCALLYGATSCTKGIGAGNGDAWAVGSRNDAQGDTEGGAPTSEGRGGGDGASSCLEFDPPPRRSSLCARAPRGRRRTH